MKLHEIKIHICEACLKGEDSECHTAGCALWLHKVDLPIHPELYEIINTYEDDEIKEIETFEASLKNIRLKYEQAKREYEQARMEYNIKTE